MAWREIEVIGVKPEGILASWRYASVQVDENGNARVQPIPGKEFPNLNKISDYKKNNRIYTNGKQVTEYCNRDTFTNFKVIAQDEKPYVAVTTELNSTKCGYLTPAPEPFVPFKPFGEATYGLYAYINLCDDKNEPIQVKIYRRNYVGAAINIKHGGSTPVILSYKNEDENKFTPIIACELRLTLVSTPEFSLRQFYTQDEREFKVGVEKYGQVKFLGFGTPSEASEEFTATPYDVTWRATDGLGALKKIRYPLPIGSNTNILQNFVEILAYCLAMTNLNLNIATIANLYEIKMRNGLDDDPLMQASVNPLRASEKGVVYNCYQVLEKVCEQFGAFIVQVNGQWHFVRQAERGNAIIRQRVYNYTGLFLFSEQYINKRVASCKSSDIKIMDANPLARTGNAIKRAEVIVDYAEVPFLIYNGDFEIWNGSNFPGWTKYGGIAVSRIEKTIQTTTGPIPSGNFALQFDELANNSKYYQASPVLVNSGDKITLTYNVGSTYPDLTRPYKGVDFFKFRINIGEYYLTNPDNDNNYKWVKQLAICNNPVYNPKGNIDTYTVSFEMPEVPVSGTMIIQLFGFSKSSTGPYYPVAVDNFGLSRSNTIKTVGRTLYISQQDGFYTEVPEQTKLIFGDFASTNTVVRPVRVDKETELKNDYYAIRTVDGSYSSEWYEYGSNSNTAPIGLCLSRAILKDYQKPFMLLANAFLGNNISYLDILTLNLPDDPELDGLGLGLLSGDFNLMTNEVENANYAEIFTKFGKSVDIIVPGVDGDPSPPITQNPNPAPPQPLRIFTNEFTNQFV